MIHTLCAAMPTYVRVQSSNTLTFNLLHSAYAAAVLFVYCVVYITRYRQYRATVCTNILRTWQKDGIMCRSDHSNKRTVRHRHVKSVRRCWNVGVRSISVVVLPSVCERLLPLQFCTCACACLLACLLNNSHHVFVAAECVCRHEIDAWAQSTTTQSHSIACRVSQNCVQS